ncbi:MAG TPA: hypothetical protein VEY51_10245, partial [Chondromyces sp.]|nr:hypothetical protein [Chondromyces sp.]
NTLEQKELCYRKSDSRDKRLTYLVLTEKGKQVMEDLYPQFHKGEIEIVSGLSVTEQKSMEKLLRLLIRENDF